MHLFAVVVLPLSAAAFRVLNSHQAEVQAGGAEAAKQLAEVGPVQTAWNNHFAAFAAGAIAGATAKVEDRKLALDKIMLDYDADSAIAVFNDKCTNAPQRNGYKEYKTPGAIRNFFDALFQQIVSVDNLDAVGPTNGAPVVLEGNSSEANVFLTWRTKSLPAETEIKYATDSFSFKEKNGKAMIWKQNIVLTEPMGACDAFEGTAAACTVAEKTHNPMCAGWENHFFFFDAGCKAAMEDINWMHPTKLEAALDGIMKDYTADSYVQIFDNRKKQYDWMWGLGPIRSMFQSLFRDINAAKTRPYDPAVNGVDVLVLEVEKEFNGVFLVWKSNSHPQATDTFVFNDAGKIIRQNIVFNSIERV